MKKKSRKRKTEDKAQLDESPPPSSQDPSQTDQETTASAQKAKAHCTFLEVVLNDAQVSSPQTEQPDAQEKKAAHVARLEAMIKMADSPKTTEIHKSLTPELARVTKTAKSQPNSVRLAWIAREERRLTELEADICKATEALLPNTWLPGDDPQLWKIRVPWDSIRELRFGEGGKQIDFIALSKFQSVDDVKIARDLMFSSDHFPLTISCSSQNRRSQTSQHRQQDHRHSKTRLPPVRNWQPNDNWYNAIRQSTLSWQDWDAIPRLHEMAHEHAKPRVNTQVDVELESLRNRNLDAPFGEPAAKPRDNGPSVNWRVRVGTNDVIAACTSSGRRHLVPNGDASKQLFDYYSGVYELAPEQREKEETAKAGGKVTSRQEHSLCTSLLRF